MKTLEKDYYTVKDALAKLNIGRATLYSKINEGSIKSEKIGKNRFIYIDDAVCSEHTSDRRSIRQDEQTNQTQDILEQLEYFKNQTNTLQLQLAEQALQYTEASKRHDTIVMQMQSTIEKQQLQLESSQPVSFFRRLFGVFQS
jgi:excisionase family DNA binding protein